VLIKAFRAVYALAQRVQMDMRTAALMLGVGRVADGKQVRGLFP
jgi:glutamate dehydrogenase (NAD(P)+)